MATQRHRLIRRATLAQRVKAYLNPGDFLLWLSEELNGDEFEEFVKEWSIPLGIALNVTFMVARANSNGNKSGNDDVFGDSEQRWGSGWLSWLASFTVHLLTLVSFGNAAYTFLRKRHYRLFEAAVDETPQTPSARRVRVDSSPAPASPFRFFKNIIATTTAESRAHPDPTRDVWEVAVWDPTPICLRLFCLFSPGHAVVYWFFLPLHSLDPRPSVTVVTVLFLAMLLSIQLYMLQSSFIQQAKDSTLIHKEVLHEYDVKFVHPMLHKRVRDVGTQVSAPVTTRSTRDSGAGVITYTPTININRGFKSQSNPNYSPHYDPDGVLSEPRMTTPGADLYQRKVYQSVTSPGFLAQTPNVGGEYSSPIRPSTAAANGQQPLFRPSSAAGTGDGGSFGVYSHTNSPIKQHQSPLRRDVSPLRKTISSRSGQLPNRAPVFRSP